jgi:hypothetical protein
MTARRQQTGLVGTLLVARRVIGVLAVLGIFYLTVPWRLIRVILAGEELTSGQMVTVMRQWAYGFADSIPYLVLLTFIAVLTYGPEALDLLGGPRRSRRPPR